MNSPFLDQPLRSEQEAREQRRLSMLDTIAPHRTRYAPPEPAYYDAIENEWRSGFADLPRQSWTGNDGKATRVLLDAIDFSVKP